MKHIKAKFTISDLDWEVIIQWSFDVRPDWIQKFEKDLRICIWWWLSYVSKAHKEWKWNLYEAFKLWYELTLNLVFKKWIDLSDFITEEINKHIDLMFIIKIET